MVTLGIAITIGRSNLAIENRKKAALLEQSGVTTNAVVTDLDIDRDPDDPDSCWITYEFQAGRSLSNNLETYNRYQSAEKSRILES